MSRKTAITITAILFTIFLVVSMFVLPIDDDWFFLRYFPLAENWEAHPYHWLNDNILLPRNYWRPIEDVLLFSLARHPEGFPYVNHFLTVAGCFATAITAWRITVWLGCDKWRSLTVLIIAATASTSMGAMMSIDSLTHVGASLFGFLSMLALLQRRFRLWLLFGLTAMFFKESGVVYIAAGLLLDILTDRSDSRILSKIRKRRVSILAGAAISAAYCLAYFFLTRLNAAAGIPVEGSEAHDSVAFVAGLTASQTSHALTPATFIKNIFIIFVGGIWPIDTSAVYYPAPPLVILTGFLGLGGPLFVIYAVRHADAARRRMALRAVLTATLIALPSLVTRAGEISPFPSNLMLGVALCCLLSGLKIGRAGILVMAMLTATLITDAHKIGIAVEGGMQARRMAREVVEMSPDAPEYVLWVGVDEFARDRSGAAFNRSAYRGFYKGAAAIREYDYRYPLRLHKITVPESEGADNIVDSIAIANLPLYDCIWITSGDSVRVVSRP